MSVQGRITAALVFVVVLLGATVLVATVTLFPRYLRLQLKSHGGEVAAVIAGQTRVALLSEDWFALKAAIAKETARHAEVAYIFILDDAGHVLAHTFEDGFPTMLRQVNPLPKGMGRHTRLLDTGPSRIYDIAEGVWIGEDLIGTVRVGMDEVKIRRIMRHTIGAIVLATLGVMVIGMVIGVGLSALIVRPIDALAEGTRIIGAGNLDHSVATDARDEIGRLSRSFDTMVGRLKTVMASRDDLDREVAQRKQAEKDLQKTLINLEQSNQDLEQFAYSASHDLQEPLRKILAFGSLLEKKYGEKIEGDGKLYMATMRNATERMQTLISDLLGYSRVTTRGDVFAPVDMNETVCGVLSDLETRIAETEARVDIADLPAIEADPTQMRQLMQNLIGNALKFHKVHERPRVEVYADIVADVADAEGDPAAHCQIVVKDNGIGFDEKYTDRIFGVFQRLHRRNEYSGSGIGLAVCRRIAERHGGTITAESKEGEGASFTVTLPLKHVENEMEGALS